MSQLLRLLRNRLWRHLADRGLGTIVLRKYVELVRRDVGFVDNHTEIVIEGYPRSANTYAVATFRVLNGHNRAIAHHVHTPRQVIEGVRLNKPIVLLVREPMACIASLLVRYPFLHPRTAFLDYIHFHEGCIPVCSACVVASFENVTDDFGSILARVNHRFDTAFNADFDPITRARALAAVDDMDRRDRGTPTVTPTHVARPSEERALATQIVFDRLKAVEHPLQVRALKVYDELAREIDPGF